MSGTVLKKGVDGLSLIGLSSTCRAANLLAKTNVDLHEEGMFTGSALEELSWALREFAQRWRVGGKYICISFGIDARYRADSILAIHGNIKV